MSGFVPAVNQQQIVLLHAEYGDVVMISNLLSDEPFDIVPHAQIDTLKVDAVTEQAGPPQNTIGVLVCARSEFDTDKNIANELTCLSSEYDRVLVLADSTDEAIVCEYLLAGAHQVISLGDSPRLIQARLLAGLREHNKTSQSLWRVGSFVFDVSRRVVSVKGVNLKLSSQEFEFAQFLFSNRERVIPSAELLERVWSAEAPSNAKRIDTAACRLRKKMRLNESREWHLRRVGSDGYQLSYSGDEALFG